MDRPHIKKGLQDVIAGWVKTFDQDSAIREVLEYDAIGPESVVLDNLTDYVMDIIDGVEAGHYNTD